jgi:hypothetical protein
MRDGLCKFCNFQAFLLKKQLCDLQVEILFSSHITGDRSSNFKFLQNSEILPDYISPHLIHSIISYFSHKWQLHIAQENSRYVQEPTDLIIGTSYTLKIFRFEVLTTVLTKAPVLKLFEILRFSWFYSPVDRAPYTRTLESSKLLSSIKITFPQLDISVCKIYKQHQNTD